MCLVCGVWNNNTSHHNSKAMRISCGPKCESDTAKYSYYWMSFGYLSKIYFIENVWSIFVTKNWFCWKFAYQPQILCFYKMPSDIVRNQKSEEFNAIRVLNWNNSLSLLFFDWFPPNSWDGVNSIFNETAIYATQPWNSIEVTKSVNNNVLILRTQNRKSDKNLKVEIGILLLLCCVKGTNCPQILNIKY